MQKHTGKRVYITGGSSGIGLALAIKYASLGAHLAIFGRNIQKLEDAVTSIKSAFSSPESQQVVGISLDLCDEEAVATTMSETVLSFGVPEILILSAGGTVTLPFRELKVHEFNSVIQTNLMGTVGPISALLPSMSESGGSVMLVSSMGGIVGAYGYSAYSSSKFALLGLGEVLRWEFTENNISVSVLCPPEVATPFVESEKATIPIEARIAKDLLGTLSAEYVADYAIRGLSRKKYLIIPGFRAKGMYVLTRIVPVSLLQGMSTALIRLLIKLKK